MDHYSHTTGRTVAVGSTVVVRTVDGDSEPVTWDGMGGTGAVQDWFFTRHDGSRAMVRGLDVLDLIPVAS